MKTWTEWLKLREGTYTNDNSPMDMRTLSRSAQKPNQNSGAGYEDQFGDKFNYGGGREFAAGNHYDPATRDQGNAPRHDTEYNDFGMVPDTQLNPQQLMQKNSRRRIIPGSPEWNKMDDYQKMTKHHSPANTMWQNQGLAPAADRAKIYAQQGKTDKLQPWEQNPVPHPYMRKN